MTLTAHLEPVSRAHSRLTLPAVLSALLWMSGLLAALLIAYLL